MQLYDVLKHFVNLTQASFRVSRMTKSEHPPLRALQIVGVTKISATCNLHPPEQSAMRLHSDQ